MARDKQQNRPPQTLLEAVRYFADLDVATEFVAKLRWPDGPTCPACGSKSYSYLSTRRLWKCKDCKKQYSVKKGTIFEDSPLGLDKWLAAVWMVANCKNGVSSHELARSLGVTQKSAWFMLHRIRLAMQTGSFRRVAGEVEVDETYIGARARNMHKDVRKRKGVRQGGLDDKTAVMGILERGGKVRTQVLPAASGHFLKGEIRKHVESGAAVYSDSNSGYRGLDEEFVHKVVDHSEQYVNGRVHVNGLENFWSLLKRSLGGTYVSVEPFHLFRYLDEQSYRYNNRESSELGRVVGVLQATPGRRVTYKRLTGKDS